MITKTCKHQKGTNPNFYWAYTCRLTFFSSHSILQPKRLTIFLCWSLTISIFSFMNSSRLCLDLLEIIFTYNNFLLLKNHKLFKLSWKFTITGFLSSFEVHSSWEWIIYTLYNGPKPPSSSLLAAEKLLDTHHH
jgi:hypothetical protein